MISTCWRPSPKARYEIALHEQHLFFPEYLRLHQNPRKSKWRLAGAILQCAVHPQRYKPFSVADTIATEAFSSHGHQDGLWGKKAPILQLCLWTGAHVYHGTLALHDITKILFQVSESLITCNLFSLLLQNNPPILGKYRVSQQKLTLQLQLLSSRWNLMPCIAQHWEHAPLSSAQPPFWPGNLLSPSLWISDGKKYLSSTTLRPFY